ncbi:MAG: PLP-dependent aminotransferase family protein [Rhizobium sp.]|nr:PLP-dependent aminotransferase family protein [Rhizobium sp.]
MSLRYAERMTNMNPSALRQLLQLGADPEVISFGGGYPDASIFPLEHLSFVFNAAINDHGREALQYTVPNGLPRLRQQVAERAATVGIDCTSDEVLILQGGQQGLDLAAKMMINKGDVVIMEDPTFLGALAAFTPYEPRYVTVPMDAEGMDMAALERALKANPEAKFIYSVPEFQNPTGVTMSLARRKSLIELANRFDMIIIEDTPYREIRFQGEAIPPLKSMDTENRVIHLGSFSKILAPGLRLGWAIASDEIIQRMTMLKLGVDTQCSTLNMKAVSLFLENFDIESHIVTIRQTYLRKKNLMLETIRQTFPQQVSFTEPSGGLFTWLTFPEGFDTALFMKQRALPEARVAYVPGAAFFANEPKTNHARISYSTQTDEAIVKGMTALGQLLKESI